MSTTVRVQLRPAAEIIQAHGLDRNGDVQRYWTNLVNRRITAYMPFRTGALATKLKYISDPITIVVNAPYARYQYAGKVMVNTATGSGPRFIPGIGFRWPKGATLAATNRDLQYDTTKNAKAGPFWDRRLIAAEKSAMIEEMRRYVAARSKR